MTTLCEAPWCRDDPRVEDSPPRLAALGLRLCAYHANRLRKDAAEAAYICDELAVMLDHQGRLGERSANKPGSREPNEAAVWARSEIRHTLTAWVKYISEQRGISLPHRWAVQRLPEGFIGPAREVRVLADYPHALAAYIGKHSEWLAANELAGDASSELNQLAYGQPRRVAYPSGARRYQLKDPMNSTVACLTEGCDGTLWALLRTSDSLLPSELACDLDDTHRLPAHRWLTLTKQWRRKAA